MKNFFCLSLLMLAFVLAACTEVTAIYDNPQKELITFSPVTGLATKAGTSGPVVGSTFPTDREIWVAAYYNDANGGTSGNYFPFTKFTYQSSSASTIWECTNRFWPFQGTLDFLAWSTTNESLGTVTAGSNYSASMTYALTTADVSDDFLVGGKAAAVKTSNAIEFKHAKTQIAFQVKSSENYNSTDNTGITITGITLKSIRKTGVLTATRSTNDVSFSWDLSGVTPADQAISVRQQLTNAYVDYGTPLLLPAQDKVDILITYTMHNGKDSAGDPVNVTGMTYKYEHTVPGTWNAGYKYLYQINMSMNFITVRASVADWNDGGSTPIEIN